MSAQSSVCTRFVHNAWKKDFCSNCFKSKEEHKVLKDTTKQMKQHQPDATPTKSSIKVSGTKKKKHKVSFPKELSEVIGFGGEWADSDQSASDNDDPIITSKPSEPSPVTTPEAEIEVDFTKLTKSNTDFNTNINNLITPPVESNIKRSFAALKLGSSSPKEAKKETLKITVLPFGSNSSKISSKVTEIKQIFGSSTSVNSNGGAHSPTTVAPAIVASTGKKTQLTVSASPLANKKTEIVSTCKISTVVVQQPPPTDTDGANGKFEKHKTTQLVINNSPEIVSVTEKSLLEEISETLEKNKTLELSSAGGLKPSSSVEVVDSIPKKDAVRLEIKNPLNKVLPTTTSTEVIYSSMNTGSHKRLINRNVPITKDHVKPKISVFSKKFETAPKEEESDASDLETSDFYENVKARGTHNDTTTGKSSSQMPSSFFSSQLISDMFLANKPISKHLKSVHSEVYDLSERTYGKITSDGLIMTKNIGDATDSHTSSNFDSSSSSSCSDEEITQRSESDSGIVANEYQSVIVLEQQKTVPEEKCDEDGLFYDDVHSDDSKADTKPDVFLAGKSRELAGEPDGSSDPDSNSEAPALPSSSPPAFTDLKQSSFVHGTVKQAATDKPKVPLKPNNFLIKTSANHPIQASKDLDEPDHHHQEETDHVEEPVVNDKLIVSRQSSSGSDVKSNNSQKKGRAPNPPPSPELKNFMMKGEDRCCPDPELNTIYMRNPMANLKSSSPVVREKDKRERATINPKFRSLNSINSFQKNMILNRATTPEPMPRKSLSLSHENLLLDGDGKSKNLKKTKLFSIKKFLRMGSSSTNLSTASSSNSKLGDIPSESRSESGSPKAKPRLVIIHPIDINTSAVEVVKSTTPTSTPDKFSDEKIVSGKPPAPPVRVNSVDANKPNRPPPPKSVETRRKQQEHIVASQDFKPTKTMDTVYANLGEVRSAIAPRKPERTASMREREERQLELIKRRAAFKRSDDERSTSSIADAVEPIVPLPGQVMPSVMELKKETMGQGKLPASKVEMFERNINGSNSGNPQLQSGGSGGGSSLRGTKEISKSNFVVYSDGIKNSVQKMTSTIDNYLKDKQDSPDTGRRGGGDTEPEAVVAQPTNLITNKFNSTNSILKDYGSPSTVTKKMHFNESVELRHYEPIVVSKQDRMSLQDPLESGSVYGGSTCSTTFRHSTPKGTSKSFANLPRAISMSYCGSEMGESEIYSPYSFCGSEAGNDVAYEDPQFGWNTGSLGKTRSHKTTNRLRMRKGRSVVHKNLEDNYGAVIVANHEALAQVLDQLQQSPPIPIQLRALANSINLRFEDFTILEGGRAVVIGRRAFHAAIWANQTPVTLSLTADCNQGVSGDLKQSSGAASGALNPIAEFFDLVPSNYLPLMPSVQIRMVQASISVLPRMYVDTLMSLGNILKTRAQQLKNANQQQQQSPLPAQKNGSNFGGSIPNLTITQKEFVQKPIGSVQNLNQLNEAYNEGVMMDMDIDEMESIVTLLPKSPVGFPSYDEIMCREVGFVMLQLVNGLKNLQAKGIEEMPLSLSNVILCKEMENKEAQARLCVLQSFSQEFNRDDEETMGTLCQCARMALTQLLPVTKLTVNLSEILKQERSESLSKIKSLLEYALWGPSDITLNGTQKERESSLQRWLDLERATVLHGLVRTRVELTVYDECHLMFLVRSTAKQMAEASLTLNNYLESLNQE